MVEIAYEQNILKSPRLTAIQQWALSYFLNHKRNKKIEEQDRDYMVQTLIADNRDFFKYAWGDKTSEDHQVTDEYGEIVEGEHGVSMGPEDIDDIESLLANLATEQTQSFGQIESEWQ